METIDEEINIYLSIVKKFNFKIKDSLGSHILYILLYFSCHVRGKSEKLRVFDFIRFLMDM